MRKVTAPLVAFTRAMEARAPGDATPLRIDAQATADGVRLAVLDAGPGMTDEQRSRAFDRFYRAAEGGAGLGLALVKRIAELHRARVTLQAGIAGCGLGIGVVFPR